MEPNFLPSAGHGEEPNFFDFSPVTSHLSQAVQPLVQDIVRELKPHLKELVREASEAAAPTIDKLVREEVIPKVGLYGGTSLVVVGLGAALIGALVARYMK